MPCRFLFNQTLSSPAPLLPPLLQVVDPDRVSNPHGEHALEAYRLLEPLEPLQQEQEQQQQDGPQ